MPTAADASPALGRPAVGALLSERLQEIMEGPLAGLNFDITRRRRPILETSVSSRVVPPLDFVHAVIQQALIPAARDLEVRTGMDLSARVSIGGAPAWPDSRIGILEKADGQPAGRVRIAFGSTFFPDRFTYVLESIYPDASPTTGWSGFALDGKVRRMPSGVVLATTGTPVMSYQWWDWSLTRD